MSSQPPTTPLGAEPPLSGSRRRTALLVLLGIVALIGIVTLVRALLVGRYHETSDNAYVGGNLVQITPEIAGTVVAVHADDTDFVTAGQALVDLDKADSHVALEQAEAELAKTVRDVRALYATTAALGATLEVRSSELKRAREDLARREAIAASGAVSTEELVHARDAVVAASAAEAAAREQWESNRAQTEGTDVMSHPLVQQAAGRVREIALAAARGTVAAPMSGYVAHRTVQLGQRVQPGASLLTLVPLEGVWVDANLKEGQVANLRIGQPVKLESDVYGSSVEFHGTVVGLAAGTGSVFSLLPAQNATGNWIKVVQRLPVRIALNRDELKQHPLRIGLSMTVDIDTTQRDGRMLAMEPPAAPRYAAPSGERSLADEDARIARIIQANAASTPGRPATTHPSRAKAHAHGA